MKLQVVVLIGLQGAGKTTFYHKYFADTHQHISKDNFRHHKKPNQRQQHLIGEALAQNQSVVIDNTNPTLAERAALIATAKAFDAEAIGYYFEPNVKRSLEQNAQRSGKQRVPDIAIYVTNKRLQPPDADEGWNQLFKVVPAIEGAFEVEAIGLTPTK
jgi:predicted kinase